MATATPVFSEQETAWHRNARFAFVPWVARLLCRGPLRGQSKPLPSGNPDCLTDETVDALREMMNLAVWKFLARDCGWRERLALSFSNPEGDRPFSRRRLWQTDRGENLPPLRFTSRSIDLLIAVYRHTRADESVEALEPPDCGDANGDLLLHHLVFRRLTGSAQALGVAADFHWGGWYANGLNALYQVRNFGDSRLPQTDWDRLTKPDVAAYFPWIGARIAENWQSDHESIWKSLESAGRWFGSHSAMAGEWIEAVAERPDLLIFLLDIFVAHAKRAVRDRERFDTATETFERRQREQVAIPWADFLKTAETLESIHRDCVNTHPIERSGPENCFLAAWEEMTFSQVADTLKDRRREIRPAIS